MSTPLRYSFGLYTLSSTPTTTRSRVLTATLDLIQRVPGPISMGAIAKEAGLSRQALYLIFEDKADLFIGLLRFVDGRRGLVEEIAKIRDAPIYTLMFVMSRRHLDNAQQISLLFFHTFLYLNNGPCQWDRSKH